MLILDLDYENFDSLGHSHHRFCSLDGNSQDAHNWELTMDNKQLALALCTNSDFLGYLRTPAPMDTARPIKTDTARPIKTDLLGKSPGEKNMGGNETGRT